MPDGVRLSARLWLPATDKPVPAVLEYIPYRKRDMVRARDECNHPAFARAGYASLRVDMRGSGDSEGIMSDMYLPDELDDALHVIAWIAAADWCDGRVGMMGTSWGGTAALQAAAQRPTALKAVIAVCATDNRYDDDIHHMGGCLLTDSLEWGAALPAILALPPDPQTVGEGWRAQWMQRLEAAAFPLENWIRHEACNAYWRHGSVCETAGAIECPTLAIGGWTDRYSNSVMNLLADNPTTCWGIVGPWGHHYPDLANPGPGIDFQRVAIAWWDRWLGGIDNGADRAPRLRAWMQAFDPPQNWRRCRSGRWIAEDHWPSPSVTDRHVYPAASGALTTSPAKEPCGAKVPPSLHTGLAAGDTGYFGRAGGLPLDQAGDDARCLLFETGSLDEAMEVLGKARIVLCVAPFSEPAVLSARLVDVAPDGGAARVVCAVRNLALDDGLSQARPEGDPVCIDFPNTAYCFAAGHRLRLALGLNYWPQIWPGRTMVAVPLRLSDCVLTLPVRPARADVAVDLPVTEGSGDDGCAHGPERSLRHDRPDQVCLEWHRPTATTRFEEIGIAISQETRARHAIDGREPLSAVSEVSHSLHLERDGETISTTGRVRLTAGTDAYHLQGSLVVTENGRPLFQREWSPEIPRRLA